MLGFPFPVTRDDAQVVVEANSYVAGGDWTEIEVPEWARFCHIFLFGAGAAGGAGAVGANSTAAGGGGGGSGGQTTLLIPTRFLPKRLYANIGMSQGASVANRASRISVFPDTVTTNCIAIANGGNTGGNAVGATVGAAGTAAAVATIGTMPLAGPGNFTLLAGQAGTAGGIAVNAASVALPLTGLIVTGGAGGGGLPAAAAVATSGGAITGGGVLLSVLPGSGGGTATTPGADGSNGYGDREEFPFFYGGAGGGSTHGSATGAGLVAGLGGHAGPGSGGGGGGGGLTGSTGSNGGRGGNGMAVITFI